MKFILAAALFLAFSLHAGASESKSVMINLEGIALDLIFLEPGAFDDALIGETDLRQFLNDEVTKQVAAAQDEDLNKKSSQIANDILERIIIPNVASAESRGVKFYNTREIINAFDAARESIYKIN